MKILQVANKFPYPAKDGGSIATLSLSRSMAALGHQVTVLAINTSKHFTDPATIPEELKQSIRFMSIPVNTEIRLHKLAWNFLFSSLPYNAERFISKDFDKALKDLLSEEKFDIIQLEGLYLAPYLDTIRKYTTAKVVMRAHNIEHEIWERTLAMRKGIKKIYLMDLAARIRKMELQYLNSYDAILPITSRDEGILKGLGCTIPSHVVPTGINSAELLPDHQNLDFPSVFHIGALDWMPNQEGLKWFFENAWDKILDKHPELKFYLAGRNAPEYFRNLPYRNVIFLGEVDDAYDFIRSRAIMIVPILSGSGMRIKIIEGMALGKAIVTTSTGTEGIAATHRTNVFIEDDPEGFASSVCELAEDRNYCLKIGENARTFVTAQYDNFAISSSLLAFYQNLLK
jgi:glycosyltransferase involved in cell wall biosynthesis